MQLQFTYSTLIAYKLVLLVFCKKFWHFSECVVIDIDWYYNPYHIASNKDEPKVFELQITIKSWRPVPILQIIEYDGNLYIGCSCYVEKLPGLIVTMELVHSSHVLEDDQNPAAIQSQDRWCSPSLGKLLQAVQNNDGTIYFELFHSTCTLNNAIKSGEKQSEFLSAIIENMLPYTYHAKHSGIMMATSM